MCKASACHLQKALKTGTHPAPADAAASLNAPVAICSACADRQLKSSLPSLSGPLRQCSLSAVRTHPSLRQAWQRADQAQQGTGIVLCAHDDLAAHNNYGTAVVAQTKKDSRNTVSCYQCRANVKVQGHGRLPMQTSREQVKAHLHELALEL